MSASNAPPNPGAPKHTGRPANPTMLARHGSKILAGGVLLGTLYAYLAYRPEAPQGTAVNPLSTPGVKNIEGAYRSGGATGTHTKAYGGTVQGDKDGDQLREGGGTGNKQGLDHPDIGDAQRGNAPSKPMQKFKEMQYGSGEGK